MGGKSKPGKAKQKATSSKRVARNKATSSKQVAKPKQASAKKASKQASAKKKASKQASAKKKASKQASAKKKASKAPVKKKASAKKASAKKASAKKASAKKASAKQASAKQASAKQASAKQASKQAPAKKASKQAPAKKAKQVAGKQAKAAKPKASAQDTSAEQEAVAQQTGKRKRRRTTRRLPLPDLPPVEAPTADDLFQAIGEGDTGRVRALLAAGISPDTEDEENAYTALELAAALGELEVIGALLAGGASPNRGVVQTPLEAASHEGHGEVVRCLLAAGADVNRGGEEAVSPLMSAAAGNHVEVLVLLLEHGAQPGARSDVGDTALHAAAVNGAEQAYDLLYALTPEEEQGRAAQLLQRARDENTRRIRRSELAAEAARSQELIDGELTARGAERVRVENGIYEITFDWGVESGEIHTAADHGYVSILRALLVAGTPVDEREYLSGHTALMRAAAAGQTEAALLLMEYGAAVNATDSFQSTPLLHAVALPSSSEGRRRRLEIVRELIRRGADVDARTRDGETALLLATRWGDSDAVGALVVAGCDVTARNSAGEGAADLAGDNETLVELLSGLGQAPRQPEQAH